MACIKETFSPAFHETDALGHINNTVVPRWFEKARLPLFKVFTPGLDPREWRLIIVKIEVEYKAQIGYESEVTIETEVESIGNSSFVVRQRVVQNGQLAAQGKTVMVHFDYDLQKPVPLTDDYRAGLEQFLVTQDFGM